MHVTLPGRADRIHVALLAALIAVVLLACGVIGEVTWRHHSAAVAARSLQRAESRLASLSLPPEIARSGRRECEARLDRLCAITALTPIEARPLLRQLLGPTKVGSAARLLERYSGPHGPVTIFGTIDGYPAVAFAFAHLVVVRHGKPPERAVPVKPGSRHLFFRGSDIEIDLVTQ